MKITAVRTYLLNHTLPHACGTADYYYRERQILLVKIETDDGPCGWGETAAFPGLRAVIHEQFEPLLKGKNPVAHRPLWRALWGPNFGNGMAMGAIDIALDDLRGKVLGLPVAELYGGRLRDRVATYCSSRGYLEGVDPREQLPQDVREAKARGFQAFKFRIGAFPIPIDAAALSAAREEVGPDFKLLADANGAYSLASAIEMGRELEKLNFYWYEEPLQQTEPDYSGYEVITAQLDIAVAGGEALTKRGMFKEVILRRAMDIVQPDPTLAGGIGECLFIAEMSRLWGIPCMPHCWAGGIATAAVAHLVSLLPDASYSRAAEPPMLEMSVEENPFLDQLLVEPLHFQDGWVTVPTKPGLGIEVDEDKLRFYSQT